MTAFTVADGNPDFINSDQLIDYGWGSVTIMATDLGTYVLVTNTADGACDETLIYPSGKAMPFDAANPTNKAMASVAAYLAENYA